MNQKELLKELLEINNQLLSDEINDLIKFKLLKEHTKKIKEYQDLKK